MIARSKEDLKNLGRRVEDYDGKKDSGTEFRQIVQRVTNEQIENGLSSSFQLRESDSPLVREWINHFMYEIWLYTRLNKPLPEFDQEET